MSNTRSMCLAFRACLPSAVLSLALAAAPALANPHVWVETWITFEFEDHRVEGLRFAWRFDDFYSAHAIRTHDLDGNGTFEPMETRALRTDAFDPLARFDYHVHVWVGDARRAGHEVDRFSARIEDQRLVYEFSLPVTPPADPGAGPVIVSVFDGRNEVDFRFADSDFLLADGAVKPGCGFRIGRGQGVQSGHPRLVTLTCGE